jgi:hypothetical protein
MVVTCRETLNGLRIVQEDLTCMPPDLLAEDRMALRT